VDGEGTAALSLTMPPARLAASLLVYNDVIGSMIE
jgi:hypothetical protein